VKRKGCLNAPTPGRANKTNSELIDDAQSALKSVTRALQNVTENEAIDHLIAYAFDGIGSAKGYLETARRRLDDPVAK